MNRFYAYCILCTFIFLPISYHNINADQELHTDDEIELLFEDENDTFADAAAQTMVMQQEIKIKPVSWIALKARKAWDRVLIVYLWFQQKYARMRVYLRARLQRTDSNYLEVTNTADSENRA